MSQRSETTEALHRDWFGETFAKQAGESAAINDITHAKRIAEAKAARLLAERECPPDLIEWGRAHGIPTFAEMTWQAGLLTGMRLAALSNAQMVTCRHEPYQGRCAHCDVPFKNGRPVL